MAMMAVIGISPVYIAVRHCLRYAVGSSAPVVAAAFGRYALGMMQPEQKSISTFKRNRSSIPYNPLPARLYTARINDTDKAEQIARSARFFADMPGRSEEIGETVDWEFSGMLPRAVLAPIRRAVNNIVYISAVMMVLQTTVKIYDMPPRLSIRLSCVLSCIA